MLPRAGEAFGMREKLAGYSLDESHEEGGPKARGFRRVLGITLADLDHLEAEIAAGIARTPIASVRDNAPYGVNCVVDGRHAPVRTVWELRGPGDRPRLVSAYLKP